MAGEERRLQRIAPLEESILLSGVWNVVEEIEPELERLAHLLRRDPEPVEQAPRAAVRVLERRAQQVVELQRPVVAGQQRVQRRAEPDGDGALIVGGPKLRRAASTSSPRGGRRAVRAIATSRCSLSMLLEPWRAASSRARISAARASADSAGERGAAAARRRGRGSGDARPGARCRAAARRRRTSRPACRARGDVGALQCVELGAQRGQRAQEAVGSAAVSARSSSDKDPLGVRGHTPTTRRDSQGRVLDTQTLRL